MNESLRLVLLSSFMFVLLFLPSMSTAQPFIGNYDNMLELFNDEDLYYTPVKRAGRRGNPVEQRSRMEVNDMIKLLSRATGRRLVDDSYYKGKRDSLAIHPGIVSLETLRRARDVLKHEIYMNQLQLNEDFLSKNGKRR